MDMTTVEELLTTTRSVRKRLDLKRPVPMAVLEKCLEIALQAPTGSNAQRWRYLVVNNPEKRAQIAQIYARSFAIYLKEAAANAPKLEPNDPRVERGKKVVDSAVYLSRNLAQVPVHILCCTQGRVEEQGVFQQASLYGSILPAAWSLMLALRAHGLGSAWTTLHLRYEEEVAQLLEIPADYTQAVLLPVAYYTGDGFRPAKRVPARELTYLNSWGRTRGS